MWIKLQTIILKMSHVKRRYKTGNTLVKVFVTFLLTIILPSLLIFWTFTEGRRTLTSGQLQPMESQIFEREMYNWKPLLEKMNERKRSLSANCKYLVQHHKKMFSGANISHQNKNGLLFVENSNSIICDQTKVTESVFCPSQGDSVTCPLLKRKDVKITNTKNTFLVVQHPFKRIVSIFKSLSTDRKKEMQKLLRINVNEKGGKDELLFADFVAYFLQNNQLEKKWLPIQMSCPVCSTTIDYIINVENILEEKNYLLYKTTGIEPPYQSVDDLEMLVPSDFEVNFYFSKLRKDVILKLYQLFRLDFELFNYKLNTYLSMGIDVAPPTNGKTKQKL